MDEERRKRYRELGHLGGLKGGLVRAQSLSPERRKEIARMGGLARHKKASLSDPLDVVVDKEE